MPHLSALDVSNRGSHKMPLLSLKMPNMRVVLLTFGVLALSMVRSIFWGFSMELRSYSHPMMNGDETSPVDLDQEPTNLLPPPPTMPPRPPVELFTIPTDEWNKPPDLAPWQETDKPLCTRQQIRQGKWVPIQLDKAPYVTPTTHLRCYPKEYFAQRPFPTFRWQPDDESCDFSKFRYEMMCKLLADATVMIAGDSLSWEQYSSLVQMLGHSIHQGFQHQSLEFRSNIVQHLDCGKTERKVRLVYRRDDKLEDLKYALSQDFPTVLVLNRGAHYTNDTALMENIHKNVEILHKYWWKPCEQHGLQCHLFWRTTVPGHPHCAQFSQPVNNRTAMEEWIANRSNYDDHTLQYHWYDYQRQNVMVEKFLLSKANFPVTILDAYDINILRPDEHRAHQGDCLHNCYPGKMDVYNQLMLHYVRKDRTMEAVQNQRLVGPGLPRSTDEPTAYDKAGWTRARKEREDRKNKKRHESTYRKN